MGGDHGGGHAGGDFRQKVWSMTGGPYCRPVHWRRNTAIAMFGVFLICIPIAMKSAELEICGERLNIYGVLATPASPSPANPISTVVQKLWQEGILKDLPTSMKRGHLASAFFLRKLVLSDNVG